MPRYIDADVLIKRWSDEHGGAYFLPYEIIRSIDEQPTADVQVAVQVQCKHGEWINRSLNIVYPEWERYTCSVCGKHAYAYDFCPNCGAEMRGGEDA